MSNDILCGPGSCFLLFPCRLGGHKRQALLILDAASGRFREALALRVTGDDFSFLGYPASLMQPWMLRRGVFYGFLGGNAWAIHPKDGRVEVHGPDRVEKVSVLEEVEKILGPLPGLSSSGSKERTDK